MSIKKFITKSRFHLFFSVLPLVVIAAGAKVAVHYAGWEFIPKDMTSFFPSILTGIIFILGFILAGVVTDYKESERMPNDMATSLYILWQETCIAFKTYQNAGATSLQNKLKTFVPMLKKDFFLERNNKIYELLDSFNDEFAEMDKNVAPPLMGRLRNEQAAIKKMLYRIEVIKDTDFVPSVFVSIRAITVLFLLMYCFLSTDPATWWGGIILVSIFTFVIFSIIFLIADMEDPFEYDEDIDSEMKSDEVSLAVLTKFHSSIIEK
jgi:predicted membrane chloride channel (bestrophin family)